MVLGVQQDFSWRQVGLAALGGAVSGALGGIPGTDGITQVSPGLINTGTFDGAGTLLGLAQRGGQAMLGNAITQGLAVATGLQDRYQWRQVAASAFAAPVGQLVGAYAGAYMSSFGASLAGGLTSGLIRSAIYNKGKVDYASIAADAFGNALGNSVVAAAHEGNQIEPVSMLDANTRIDSRLSNWSTQQMDLYQALVDAMESPGTSGYSTDFLLAAGPDFRVEISGVGWIRDFQLDDGLVVLKSATDAADLRRKIIDLPLDGLTPDIPGYSLHEIEVFERLGVRDAYYMPAPIKVDSLALLDEFRRFEIAQTNAVQLDFQAINDQRVAAGSYDRFGEIRSAWSVGRYGDVWRHMTFEASTPARAAVYERLFPQPSPTLARLDQMIASPIGAGVSGIANLMGASQHTQDRLLGTFGTLEQLAGALTGVYKQTLTARAPLPTAPAARSRGSKAQSASPLDVGTYGAQSRRSVGDGMTPDHIPSFAAIRLSVETKLRRSLTPAEATKLWNETNTLMIDTKLHQQASRTYGGRNTSGQVSRDALDLGAAALRDEAVLRPQLLSRGYSQKQIDEAFARLHAANKEIGWY